jgi:hypothetical protein
MQVINSRRRGEGKESIISFRYKCINVDPREAASARMEAIAAMR